MVRRSVSTHPIRRRRLCRPKMLVCSARAEFRLHDGPARMSRERLAMSFFQGNGVIVAVPTGDAEPDSDGPFASNARGTAGRPACNLPQYLARKPRIELRRADSGCRCRVADDVDHRLNGHGCPSPSLYRAADHAVLAIRRRDRRQLRPSPGDAAGAVLHAGDLRCADAGRLS